MTPLTCLLYSRVRSVTFDVGASFLIMSCSLLILNFIENMWNFFLSQFNLVDTRAKPPLFYLHLAGSTSYLLKIISYLSYISIVISYRISSRNSFIHMKIYIQKFITLFTTQIIFTIFIYITN